MREKLLDKVAQIAPRDARLNATYAIVKPSMAVRASDISGFDIFVVYNRWSLDPLLFVEILWAVVFPGMGEWLEKKKKKKKSNNTRFSNDV